MSDLMCMLCPMGTELCLKRQRVMRITAEDTLKIEMTRFVHVQATRLEYCTCAFCGGESPRTYIRMTRRRPPGGLG